MRVKSAGPGKTPAGVGALAAVACAALFAGRGWLYLHHHSPLSVFFWNENWFGSLVPQLLGVPWEAYASRSEPFILAVETNTGGFFLLCAAAALHAGWRGGIHILRDSVLLAGAVLLAFHAVLRWVDFGQSTPVLLEYALQTGAPVLLVGLHRFRLDNWYLFAAALTAATFAGHGLYALGWFASVPHEFITMTMKLTGLGEDGSRRILALAGVLDLALVVALFVPGWPRVAGLLYAFAWGTTTALARVMTHITPVEDWYGLHPWLAETILRLPHGLIPLAALVVILKSRAARESSA